MNPQPAQGIEEENVKAIRYSILLGIGKDEIVIVQSTFERFSVNPNNPNRPHREMRIVGVTGNGQKPNPPAHHFPLRRTKGVRALLILFLRSFSQLPDPTGAKITGKNRSGAHTLYEQVSHYHEPDPNWLMLMFLEEAYPSQQQNSRQPPLTHLLRGYFTPTRDDDLKEFTVSLTSIWRNRRIWPHPFLASLSTQQEPLHPSTYKILSDIISVRSKIDLYLADKKVAAAVRIREDGLTTGQRHWFNAYLKELHNRAGLRMSEAEITDFADTGVIMDLDGVPAICVKFKTENATALYKMAMTLSLPSIHENIVTLFTVDNPEKPPPVAVLASASPEPPENPSSQPSTLEKLKQISKYVKEIAKSEESAKLKKDIDEIYSRILRQPRQDKTRLEEGSTVLTVALSPENSKLLEKALIQGAVDIPDGFTLQWEIGSPSRQLQKLGNVAINCAEASDTIIAAALAKAYRLEFLLRPWRRLYSLLWLHPDRAPSASVLAASARRAYGNGDAGSQWRSLIADLKMGWLVWPVLTCLLIISSCLIARLFGQPISIGWGLATGLALSLLGAQPCSYVVSPLACHAGAIFVGWAFGFSGALLMGNPDIANQLTGPAILADPFKTITGGLLGLTAPFWRPQDPAHHQGLPEVVIGLMLVLTAAGIGLSGWLMGQATKAEKSERPQKAWRVWAGAVLGCLAGATIKGVQALTMVLVNYAHLDPDKAFAWAFASLGGIAMAAMVAWRTKKIGLRSVTAGLVHAILAFSLAEATFLSASHSSILISACLVCATCGYFHSTWFSAAYVIGEALSTTRGAVWAAMLEGIPFYLLFLISTMLHRPLF